MYPFGATLVAPGCCILGSVCCLLESQVLPWKTVPVQAASVNALKVHHHSIIVPTKTCFGHLPHTDWAICPDLSSLQMFERLACLSLGLGLRTHYLSYGPTTFPESLLKLLHMALEVHHLTTLCLLSVASPSLSAMLLTSYLFNLEDLLCWECWKYCILLTVFSTIFGLPSRAYKSSSWFSAPLHRWGMM